MNIKRVLFLLLVTAISASASPVILEQNHHIGVSKVYTYDEIENLIWAECDRK